ncbi:MAG: hypothetical protein ACM3S5_18875 [Rhodospirillales bacterium]
MARDKSPSFQFYPDSWLSSKDILLMTPAEEGAYIRLLALEWLEPDCGLPDDDEELAILSRLGEAWAGKSGKKIRAKFRAEGGRLFNDRLLEEREKQAEWSRKSSAGGKRSAEVRRGKHDSATVVQPPLEPNVNGPVPVCLEPNVNSPVSSFQSPESRSANDEQLPPDVFAWWERFIKRYPNRVAVDFAFQVFLSLWSAGKITSDDLPEIDAGLDRYLDSELWARDDGRYIQTPANFLDGPKGPLWKDHPKPSVEARARRKSAKRSSDGIDPNAEWVPSWRKDEVA